MLMLSQDFLNADHTVEILEALTDKYTMRSKAHKRLTNSFIQIVLQNSLKYMQELEGGMSLGLPEE